MIPGYQEGWIKLHRKLFRPGHWMEPSKRSPAGKREAWLELCCMAQHSPGQMFGGVALERGQFGAPTRDLADHWGWSQSRTVRFLQRLADDSMIESVCDSPAGRVYAVVEYDTYNDPPNTNDSPSDSHSGSVPVQERFSSDSMNREGKNERMKEGGGAPPPLDSSWLDRLHPSVQPKLAAMDRADRAKLLQRFVLPPGEGLLSHEVVKGLADGPRLQLVSEALVEYDGPFNAFAFAGFLKRLKDGKGEYGPKKRNGRDPYRRITSGDDL